MTCAQGLLRLLWGGGAEVGELRDCETGPADESKRTKRVQGWSVVVVITLPLPRDGGTTRTAI